jgi:hypothetical protein
VRLSVKAQQWVLEISDGKFVDHGSWRIEMLANNSGFPITQGRDEFGRRFSGPGLNQKSVSIRWAGGGHSCDEGSFKCVHGNAEGRGIWG